MDFHREWNGEGELFGDGFHGRSHDLGDGFGAASVDFEDAFVVYSQHELTPLEKEFRAESVNDEQDGCFENVGSAALAPVSYTHLTLPTKA